MKGTAGNTAVAYERDNKVVGSRKTDLARLAEEFRKRDMPQGDLDRLIKTDGFKLRCLAWLRNQDRPHEKTGS